MQKITTAQISYAVVFLCICLLPFAGMLWTDSPPISEQAKPVLRPGVTNVNGEINLYYFSQLGDYFEDNFAYRAEALDMDARIKVGLGKISPTDQVVVGKDGWLYYGGELNDYLGRSPLSQREAKNIAFNLMLVQGYVNARGAEFVFTIAPNKSSLYPQHMPYYLPCANAGDMELLKAALQEYSVSYVDMFELFGAQDEELYRLRDSHWNSDGALLAASGLFEAMGKNPLDVGLEAVPGEYVGDLEAMLYPVSATGEADVSYDAGKWQYVGEATSVADAIVETSGSNLGSNDGKLLMFRDSFGDLLLPLLAPAFEQAIFSKNVPYLMMQIESFEPDYVVIERAQRHVDLIALDPPVQIAPQISLEIAAHKPSETTCTSEAVGDFLVLEGVVDESCIGLDDDIYLQVKTADAQACFVPFRKSIYDEQGITVLDYGFKAFLPLADYHGELLEVSVLVVASGASDQPQASTGGSNGASGLSGVSVGDFVL